MRRFFVPTLSLLKICLIPLALTLLGIAFPALLKLALFFDLMILLICLYEVFLLLKKMDYELSVKDQFQFYIDRKSDILIEITNKGSLTIQAEMLLNLPRFWSQKEGMVKVEVQKGETESIPFVLHPKRRGRYSLDTINIRIFTPYKLFQVYRKETLDVILDVYPDVWELKEYFHMARNNRLFEMGIHKNRYKGRGTEIESLRDYSKDDDFRYIDWKASARMNRPISRVYQMESMNDVVFVLDCGRLMTSEEGRFSSIDLAINALIVLSHITISMGDRIRIIPFSDRIIGDFTAASHKNPMKNILKFISPVQAEFVESNYSLVFNYLFGKINKRSIVIFISDIIDDINYSLFKKNFSLLSRKHAFLFILLRDKILQEESDRESENLLDIYSITAARSMILKRNQSIAKLKHSGIRVLDILPEMVTARLVDQYLEIKASNQV